MVVAAGALECDECAPRVSCAGEAGELCGEGLRVVAAQPLDPLAVLVGDERRQRLAVVVGGYRREAPAADSRHDGPLGLHPAPRLSIVRARDELFVTAPHLERKRAL